MLHYAEGKCPPLNSEKKKSFSLPSRAICDGAKLSTCDSSSEPLFDNLLGLSRMLHSAVQQIWCGAVCGGRAGCEREPTATTSQPISHVIYWTLRFHFGCGSGENKLSADIHICLQLILDWIIPFSVGVNLHENRTSLLAACIEAIFLPQFHKDAVE